MFVGIVQSITLIAAAVLAVAGVHKLKSPAAAEAALRAQGIRVPVGSGRVLGGVEIGVGLAAAFGLPGAVVVLAVMYLGFTGFVLRAIRDDAPCGCLGRADAPATFLQAVLDLTFAVVAVISAVIAHQVDRLTVDPLAGTGLAVVLGVGTILAMHIIGPLGEVLRQTKRAT